MPACQKDGFHCGRVSGDHDGRQRLAIGQDTHGMLWPVVRRSVSLAMLRQGTGAEEYLRKPAVSINHLLNKMVRFEKNIQLLRMDMD